MLRILIVLSLALPLAAADTAWLSRAWQTEDGLLNNDVTAITQAGDGAMLIATQRGLSRFDGLRLREVPSDVPGHSGRSVTGILSAHDGTLWMVTRTVVVAQSPGMPQVVLEMPKVDAGAGHITAFFEQPDGVIWIAFEGGRLHRIEKGRIEQAAVAPGLSSAFASCAAMDRDGQVWAAGSGTLARWSEGRFTPVATLPQGKVVMAASREGGLWIGAGRKLLRHTETSGIVEVSALAENLSGARINCLHEGSSGHLWLGTTRSGLLEWDGTRLGTTPVTHDVWWLCEDRESSIWAATAGGGACRVRPRVLTLLNEPGSPGSPIARDLCLDAQGNFWTATTNGKLFVRRASGWQELAAKKDWPGPGAACVAAAPDGHVLIATSQGDLVRWDGTTFTPAPLPPDPQRVSIMAMLVTQEGELWVARGYSLFHGRSGQWREIGVSYGRVISLAQDTAGRLWAGTINGALLRIANETLVREAAQDLHTQGGGIRALLPTRDGALWIASEGGGIARLLNGHCHSITTAHGLPHNAISQLVLDQKDRLWACSDLGIFMVPLSQLAAVADGHETRLHVPLFGSNEGVPGLQGSGGGAIATPDGRVWFSTNSGLAYIDINKVGINTVPPMASIEAMTANEQTPLLLGGVIDPSSQTGNATLFNASLIKLQPGVQSLAFEFGASSFVAPKNVRIRYQLTGIDKELRYADSDRRAVYGHLPPGDYTFSVRAANNDGLWGTHDTVLNLRVAPVYYETTWFRALVLLAAIGLIIFISYRVARARYRRRTEALRREAAVQAERTRIARDMHDQVGASLTQISLLSNIALAHGSDNPQLNRLAETAREAVTALDEIVWAVDPKQDRFDSLLEYLAPQITDLAQAANLRCRLDFPAHASDRHLPATFRHHLFLIIREAVHNTIKHARATELKLRITPTDTHLTIEITDNGTGFDTKSTTGNGLTNMRTRTQELHGTLDIETTTGTRITITVPWPKS
ncbi:MAG: hypothetical protein JNJ83_14670 [Verrucomicrobiaceae bacterium]|nr:hypothetical protein [Verrucomicrobiaceae bacterium]